MATKVWLCITFFVLLLNGSVEKASADNYLRNLRGSHKGDTVEGIKILKKYLQDIGYIDSDLRNTNITTNIFDDLLESALKTYQSYYNLNVTGVVDDNTVSLLSQPRCGVPDFPEESQDYSFFPGRPKWWTYNLTYAFAPGTRGDAFDPVAKALEDWSSVSPFRFSVNNIYNNANFKINFQQFYGPHKPLAVSTEPRDGRLHFDADEKWVNGKVPGGFDIESVGLHEIGHLLGLEHSKDPNAIMYAYFWPDTVKLKLQPDDIQGLKVLYNF
ncbi:Senescence-specific family protein [Heracleum sosnowskyi]|uniref:Senescence-specific family protein n=1 Tax=Heracleum sosnowskyi TaxID=360622 RepID=A0AAD8I9R4_9APIA|nr:Senescence-specific family protein [Heracleum sosnowskyi]